MTERGTRAILGRRPGVADSRHARRAPSGLRPSSLRNRPFYTGEDSAMAQTALARYPFHFGLAGKSIVVRPLERGDENELARFFKRLPVDERAMLKDDVTNPLVIAAWCSAIDHERVLPLV